MWQSKQCSGAPQLVNCKQIICPLYASVCRRLASIARYARVCVGVRVRMGGGWLVPAGSGARSATQPVCSHNTHCLIGLRGARRPACGLQIMLMYGIYCHPNIPISSRALLWVCPRCSRGVTRGQSRKETSHSIRTECHAGGDLRYRDMNWPSTGCLLYHKTFHS